jgi:hypothetical protein
MKQAAAMARRVPSFLPVEGNPKGSLKINEHLSEGYLDIFFIIGLSDLRQGMVFLSLFCLDVAILGCRTPLPMRRGFPEGVIKKTKGKLSSLAESPPDAPWRALVERRLGALP